MLVRVIPRCASLITHCIPSSFTTPLLSPTHRIVSSLCVCLVKVSRKYDTDRRTDSKSPVGLTISRAIRASNTWVEWSDGCNYSYFMFS